MIRASLRLLKRHADAFLLWMAVVIGGTLFLMFWGAVRWSTTELWRQEWQGVHVQVFCVPESVVAVSETLRRAEGIAAVSVVLPAQGWQEVQQQLGLPELEGADTLLPAVCVATLSERIQLEDVLALQKQMEQRVGVSAVVFPMERVSELLRRRQREALWWYGGAVFGALLWLSTAVGAMRRIRHHR
jgi:cell division protein FtsX